MKKKVSLVIAGLFWVAATLFFIISGAAALSKGSPTALTAGVSKGRLCEINADIAIEVFEIKNSVNFIPIGKEHYYLVASETDEDFAPLLVRAKPSWIEKRFDEDGFALAGSVKIKGVVSGINYEVKSDINELNKELSQMGVKVSGDLYMDARYREFGVLRILSGVALIVLGGLAVFMQISGVFQGNKLMRVVLAIVSLAGAVLMIYTLSVGS